MEFKLIIKKIKNTLTPSEAEKFDEWYKESSEHKTYFHKVENELGNTLKDIDRQKAWSRFFYDITRKKSNIRYLRYAASISLFFAIASLWFFSKIEQPHAPSTLITESTSEESKIEVGAHKAILTLENGLKVTLEKGRQFSAANVKSDGKNLVYKETSSKKKRAQNILDIPRGGQFYVTLSDGTKIWINAETRLKYPVSFAEGESRKVELVYGEAYFEVSPSKEHGGANFIVLTGEHEVEVLGTQFNLKAYQGEGYVATTLVEGKVKVDNGDESLNLKPGYQSVGYRNSNQINISRVDVDNEISWKKGYFSFKNKPLEDIMKVLSRWYDFEVEFENKNIGKVTFNGVFRRAESIEDILEIIKQTNEVDYEINQKNILMN